MPSVQQVSETLPPAFREHFVPLPSLIKVRYSCKSQQVYYKCILQPRVAINHSAVMFLIAYTPNVCISFISPLYVGPIPNVKIIHVSVFLAQLEDKAGVYVTAD